MAENSDFVDSNGMLTDEGRTMLQRALLNTETAQIIINSLRDGIRDKVVTVKDAFRKTSSLEPPKDYNNFRPIFKESTKMFMKTSAGLYSDLGVMIDMLGIVAINNSIVKDDLKSISDALTKNENQRYQDLSYIEKRLEKDAEETKKAISRVKADTKITKWLERKYEDEAQDLEDSDTK